MKGYAAASAHPGKRRWTCFNVTVPVVVGLSLVGTVSVLLGLHNRFPSGYFVDESSSMETTFGNTVRVDGGQDLKSSEGNNEARVSNLMNKFAPTFPEAVNNITGKADGNLNKDTMSTSMQSSSKPNDETSHSNPKDTTSKDPPSSQIVASKMPPVPSARDAGKVEKNSVAKVSTVEETQKSCQLEFGSYCLWSIEHKEVMKDSVVKRLKDQLFVARSYYPSIAKLKGQEKLTKELKMNIQEHERMLSEAISDADLPPLVHKNIQKMDQIIVKAKSCTVDCNNVDKKFRQILDLTEDEAHFHMKQSAFLYHLGVQTMPKSHHCLSMRLTVEYFKNPSVDVEKLHAHKIGNPSFQHYIIFSRNILAASVAINSTVMNSEKSDNMVFHVLTDAQNLYAMKLWFARNLYKEAVVHVLNVEDLFLNHSYNLGQYQFSPSEEFRVSIRNNDQTSATQTRTEYVSVFGHSHFLLPEIFKDLKKVVVLDDDVVVQKDLSSLWNIDLEGKVNGAVNFCGVRFGQLKSYLGKINYNGESCAWMSGLNVIDLDRWRELDVTGIYQQVLHKFSDGSEASWRAAALPTSLLAFQDLIFPLDGSWVVSGLGHNYGVGPDTMKNAAVLHYNGNMKPWLDLGIPKYKKYWKKFITQGEPFMDQCNVNH